LKNLFFLKNVLMIPVGGGGGGEGVILLCEADSLLSSHCHSCGRKK
jgi:hypothetical protein